MRLYPECHDCLISRVSLECRLCGADPQLEEATVAACRELLLKISGQALPHPVIASMIHRRAYGLLGTSDPFRSLKEEGGRQALAVCRQVRPTLVTFRDHVLASIIGNTFDYGVRSHDVAEDFAATFATLFSQGLTIDHTGWMLPLAGRIVYFTDNCGEIVFDRLLIGFLNSLGSRITLVVRDAPILNDATEREARELGLERFVDSIETTGAGCEIGIRPELFPDRVKEALKEATLVIAKGMANYESLLDYRDLPPVAFLMAVKCDPVAAEAGVPRGSLVAILRE
jgi:uncharacterized protein with ATP-grasp and redox domains